MIAASGTLVLLETGKGGAEARRPTCFGGNIMRPVPLAIGS